MVHLSMCIPEIYGLFLIVYYQQSAHLRHIIWIDESGVNEITLINGMTLQHLLKIHNHCLPCTNLDFVAFVGYIRRRGNCSQPPECKPSGDAYTDHPSA